LSFGIKFFSLPESETKSMKFFRFDLSGFCSFILY